MRNSLIGFNFGDGHLHNAEMIRAVQREAAVEPNGPILLDGSWSLSGSQPGHGALA